MSVLRILGAGLSLLSLVPPTVATIPEGTQPKTFNFLIFPGVDAIDIMGPLEVLSTTAMKYKIDVRFIAETLEPISSAPLIASQNAQNSSAWPILTPTHTFESAPEADVLLVPGGLGMRKPELNSTLKFISDSTEKVKHVITICTGSALAARAGIMNGRKATTNKTSWPNVIGFGPNTTWIPHARWVEDTSREPPIWSSSGVTSGFDLTFHFVQVYFGEEQAALVSKLIEYVRHTDPNDDPFARNDTIIVPQ